MCDPKAAFAAFHWFWDHARLSDGSGPRGMPIGVVPPKAALCTVRLTPGPVCALVCLSFSALCRLLFQCSALSAFQCSVLFLFQCSVSSLFQ